jgi:hypothetical protein
MADLLVDQAGPSVMGELDAAETMMRRLLAVVNADHSGSWDVAEQLEETHPSNMAGSSALWTAAMKSAKIQKAIAAETEKRTKSATEGVLSKKKKKPHRV